MGLDGGTYITRSDVLRGQSWELSQADTSRSTRGGAIDASHVHRKRKLDTRTEKITKWSTCSLSGEPLAAPVVADFLGQLFNKAAVLEFLLARAGSFSEEAQVHRYINQLRTGGGAFDHLTSTKDVFEIKGLGSSAVAPPETEGGEPAAPFRCPVTDLPCDRYPFVALATCGHVFSERAQRQMADGTCSICSVAFTAQDVIPIHGSTEQIEELREALAGRRKKKKKQKRADDGGTPAAAVTAAAEEGSGKAGKE